MWKVNFLMDICTYDFYRLEAIFPPSSPLKIIAVHRYSVMFVGGLPRVSHKFHPSSGERGNRKVQYHTEIPSFLGCIRGFAFFDANNNKRDIKILDLRNNGSRNKGRVPFLKKEVLIAFFRICQIWLFNQL